MPWYTFPVEQQKNIALMLNRMHNGVSLTIGPFSELNFETATKVICL